MPSKQTSSLNISYEPIPDKELFHSGRESAAHIPPREPFLNHRARKLILTVIGLFILVGVLFSFFMSQRDAYFRSVIDERDRKSVGVYQTSRTYYSEDRLSNMSPEDYKARGLSFSNWPFEFSQSLCSEIDSVNDLSEERAGCTEGLSANVPLAMADISNSQTFQEIIGFGGAFTEAAAHNFFKLSPTAQFDFLEAYFGSEGIAYTLGRIHINSCDFSLRSYNFNDVKDDFEMKHFDHTVAHDQLEIIPLLKAALATSAFPLQLVASPWSPPGWMKVPIMQILSSQRNNNSDSFFSVESDDDVSLMTMTGSSTPNGLVASSEVMKAWALYISYFIDAYSSHGIPIWAVTPQNEPEFAAPWEACSYNSSFERKFIDDFLGPQLRKDHPKIKILGFDHNKDHLVNWTKDMISASEKPLRTDEERSYVDGMAFHWYGGTGDRMLDGTYGYDAVADAYYLMNGAAIDADFSHTDTDAKDSNLHSSSSKILLATEACSCPGVKMNSWFRAERIGHDIMFDLQNFAQGWIDWNLLVDYTGGPNHLGNLCDAPIIASEGFDHIHIQPEYFYIGHFSKFIPPKSKRILSEIIGNFNYDTTVHPDVHEGIELGVFPCERSSRQMWKWRSSHKDSSVGYLQLLVSVAGDDGPVSQGNSKHLSSEDEKTFRCMGKGDDNRRFLRVWDCFPAAMEEKRIRNKETGASLLESRRLSLRMESVDVEANIFQLVEEREDNESQRMCVSLSSRIGQTDIQAGDLLVLESCPRGDIKRHQLWKWQKSTGEMVPYSSLDDDREDRDARRSLRNAKSKTVFAHEFCLTAGWPYLTSVAFNTPSKQTVVTIMNEYPSDTYVLLRNMDQNSSMWTALNGKSIQTVTF